MQIYIRIKAAGKRQDIFERRPQEIPEGIQTAGELIAALVRENVRAYNAKTVDAPFFPCLTQQEFDDGAYTGRIGFGDRHNEAMQDEEEAVANALQCFEDGLFRLLINDTEVEGSGSAINLANEDTITLIRLVMLAGRRW